MKNKYCAECGKPLEEGSAFCGACGTKVIQEHATLEITINHCTQCAYTTEDPAKFCPQCGAKMSSAVDQVTITQERPESTTTIPSLDNAAKKAKTAPKRKNKPQNKSSDKTFKTQKKDGFFRKLGRAALWVFCLLILSTTILYFIGDNASDSTLDYEDYSSEFKDNESRDPQVPTPTDNAKFKDSKIVSEDNPIANFENVKVDFGEFIINENEEVQITEFKPQIINEECKVEIYDISIDGRDQFDDYLTITLPIDKTFINNGDINNCVAAQYYNNINKTWEPVLYEIDEARGEINIFTDHLSRYGVFTVENEKRRNAYITNVTITDAFLMEDRDDMYKDVLENYFENNKSLGKDALNAGLGFWSKFSGQSGVAINTFTVGGTYSTKFISRLNNGFKNLGYVASLVQLAYDLNYSDNKTTAINLTKNIMNQLVAEFGTATINVAFIGVYFIDVTLTELGNAMLAQKYKELFDVYDYYNRTENKRSLKEWRALMIEIFEDNPNNPSLAFKEIKKEIDNYAWKFMEDTKIGTKDEDIEELSYLAHEAGYRSMSWPKEEDIDGVYAEGKKQLIDKLFPVFTSLNKWRLNKLKEEVIKEANVLKKHLNQKIQLTITENIEQDEVAKYAKHIVAIRPLDKDADKRNWTGRLNDNGEVTTSFSFIGHFTAGMPNTVEVYRPKDNVDIEQPILVKEFTINETGKVTVLLKDDSESIRYVKFAMTQEERTNELNSAIKQMTKHLSHDMREEYKSTNEYKQKVNYLKKEPKTLIFEITYKNKSRKSRRINYDYYSLKGIDITLEDVYLEEIEYVIIYAPTNIKGAKEIPIDGLAAGGNPIWTDILNGKTTTLKNKTYQYDKKSGVLFIDEKRAPKEEEPKIESKGGGNPFGGYTGEEQK